MTPGMNLLTIFLLIAASAFFSISEISLAAARKVRLSQMAQAGDLRAARVIALQGQPGHFFTVVQIGLNSVAILGGIVGEGALTPNISALLSPVLEGELLARVSFILSFTLVTSLFVLFADLVPKRLGMNAPERLAVKVVGPMLFCISLFLPLVWLFNGLASQIFRLLGLPVARNEDVTHDDILAMATAGAESGVLAQHEQQMIENVFELGNRTVPSAMTARDSIIFLSLDEAEEAMRQKIARNPHDKFPVCDGTIDRIIGCVDSQDVLSRLLNGERIAITTDGLIRTVLLIPDTLSLTETLERFRAAREDFAVVINEYALVVGLITLNDVMNSVMGELVSQAAQEQIVRRDADSWLVDGLTTIEDVMRALDLDGFPDDAHYETIAGFIMYRLRRVPKLTDVVEHGGYRFEVIDVDSHRIDQLLVTRLPAAYN